MSDAPESRRRTLIIFASIYICIAILLCFDIDPKVVFVNMSNYRMQTQQGFVRYLLSHDDSEFEATASAVYININVRIFFVQGRRSEGKSRRRQPRKLQGWLFRFSWGEGIQHLIVSTCFGYWWEGLGQLGETLGLIKSHS